MPDYRVSGEKKREIGNKKQPEAWVWASAVEGRAFLQRSLPDAEAYIRDFFERGLDLVERYFSNPDEKEFLTNYPIYGEFPEPRSMYSYEGLGDCIARAVVLDFEYVEHFINGDFPTVRPINEERRDRVAQWLPIWKERAAETGSILPPKK